MKILKILKKIYKSINWYLDEYEKSLNELLKDMTPEQRATFWQLWNKNNKLL